MIKLIASDLDGTLLQNGAQSLPENVIPFIEKLAVEHGILFVAASGRQYPNLVRLFGSASKHMAFICENGSLVFHKDRLIAGHPMDKEAALTISHDILSLPGCELQISGEKTCYLIPKSDCFVDRMVNHVKNDVKGEEVEISADDSKVRIFIVPTNEELMIARETLKNIK